MLTRVVLIDLNASRTLDQSGNSGSAIAHTSVFRLETSIQGLDERLLQLFLQILFDRVTKTVRVAFFRVVQKAETCDARRGQEVFQFAQHDPSPVDVARLQLANRRQHRMGNPIVF
jgi:hypothetical protein